MKNSLIVSLVVATLCLVNVPTLSATSPQKSTVITINGEDALKPPVCNGDLVCELRNDGIDFIHRHGSDVVVLLEDGQGVRVCEIGYGLGRELTVTRNGVDYPCATLGVNSQ